MDEKGVPADRNRAILKLLEYRHTGQRTLIKTWQLGSSQLTSSSSFDATDDRQVCWHVILKSYLMFTFYEKASEIRIS